MEVLLIHTFTRRWYLILLRTSDQHMNLAITDPNLIRPTYTSTPMANSTKREERLQQNAIPQIKTLSRDRAPFHPPSPKAEQEINQQLHTQGTKNFAHQIKPRSRNPAGTLSATSRSETELQHPRRPLCFGSKHRHGQRQNNGGNSDNNKENKRD